MEQFTPIALIGAGGIGKTSIALTILHNDRVKQRFGNDRRFIRCDQFPSSLPHFLRRLSKVIGAGIENPEDLAPLRPFLSSREMLIIFDNAESVLDPQGPDAGEIYLVIEELSQLSNISLCITSRISTLPPNCETLEIPTLSMQAARDTFYRIYKHGQQSDPVDQILANLDFHPLSITLLATVAHQNKWGIHRVTKEWETRRTNVLQTGYNKSLAATIELSLASPMFQELGPHARELLGVVAFYPRGVDENNLGWFFPIISNRADIFDRFCVLSLTYRSNEFIRMLAPLRDHLSPRAPLSSPLLRITKDHYFSRLSDGLVSPNKPGFEEDRWIVSEDENVEHLLSVFTSIDADSGSVWDACNGFMNHLYWHKPRLVTLGPKIRQLPDNHPLKPRCLYHLSRSLQSVGRTAECEELLTRTLELCRDRGDLDFVVRTLVMLSRVNRQRKEAVQQAKEALEISEQLNDTVTHAECLVQLSCSFFDDGQIDTAEETAHHAITLLKEGDQFQVCKCHRVLGDIYRSKGNRGEAVKHLETALEIASSHDWLQEAFRGYLSLATLAFKEGRYDDAGAHIEKAKQRATNSEFGLAGAMEFQARILYCKRNFREAESEALCAADAYRKLGAVGRAESCRRLLDLIRAELDKAVPSGSGSNES